MKTIVDFFNKETLNIFTDASIMQCGNEYIGCSGAVFTTGNGEVIGDSYRINRATTNNDSELNAIFLGLIYANENKHLYKRINLFSDSNISVNNLREWIFNWTVRDNQFYNKQNNLIKNQVLVSSMVNYIIDNQLYINLYYQKGHVKISDTANFNYAKNNFETMNVGVGLVTPEVIIKTSYFNNMVDNRSRDILHDYVQQNVNATYNSKKTCDPVRFDLNKINLTEYKKYIGRK